MPAHRFTLASRPLRTLPAVLARGAAALAATLAFAAPPAAAQQAAEASSATSASPGAPRANRHALIIGVGRYADANTPQLPGTHVDRQSATQMAQAMQVPAANITYLQDEQATGDNIRAALAALNERVADGDRVFIHYSGHGTRYKDPAAGGCVEALLAYDGGARGTLTNREVAELLKPITAKTDKLFVMYDACHSGGLVRGVAEMRTRGVPAADDEGALRPKFAAISEECSQPVNVRTRNLVVEAVAQGGLPQDIIHLSASRDNEVSFDDARKGGLATQYMRDCMLGETKDLDGSGAITIDEIRICAQEKINRRMQGNAQFTAHNLTLGGNASFVPAWFAQGKPVAAPTSTGTGAVAAGPAADGAARPTTLPATPQPAPASATANTPANTPAAGATPAPAPLTGAQALRQVYEQRDAKRRVQVALGRPTMKIGQDALDLSVQSDRAGYVYLALAGSDNRSLYLLFPNDIDSANRIEAGQRLALPRPNWRVKAGGPAGTNQLLVVVADSPRDLSAFANAAKAGPFVTSLNDAQGRARLGALMTTARRCDAAPGVDRRGACADAFGAAIVQVEEVR